MNRYWMMLPLVCLTLASMSSAQNPALNEGVQLIREGKFDQALVRLQDAHRVTPRDPAIENLLGITETRLAHIEEADSHYRNAIRLDPAQSAPHRNLGFNLLTAKKYDLAEPELREASRLNPRDPFAHYYLLLLALATQRDAEALNQAAYAGQLVGTDPETAAQLAEAQIRLGHINDASKQIERLEEGNQLSAAREYAIALLLSQHAFYAQAVHSFRHIAAQQPSWQNRYNLALALLYDNQPSEASSLLSALHTAQPANADILMYLGSAFEMQEKSPQALEAYRAALAADPSNPDRTLDYTRVLMDIDRYDQAIQVVQSGLGQTAVTPPLELRLGAIQMVKGNYPAARDAFHAALAADPDLDVAYVGLAETYAREANDAEAIRVIETAREKRRGHYLLEYYFGMLAARLGRTPEALIALENAARLQPPSPDPFFELGKLYVAQQNWPQARKALEHVVELNPRLAPAHYQLSRVYEHLGLSSQAKQEAQQTRVLIDAQRNDALRRQREQGASFQPQTPIPASR